MREDFTKYQDFKRIASNSSIDKSIISLFGMTFVELIVGLCLLMIGLYGVTFMPVLGAFIVILSFCLPLGMKKLRETMPKNIFFHFIWYMGLFKNKHRVLKRPQRKYMGP